MLASGRLHWECCGAAIARGRFMWLLSTGQNCTSRCDPGWKTITYNHTNCWGKSHQMYRYPCFLLSFQNLPHLGACCVLCPEEQREKEQVGPWVRGQELGEGGKLGKDQKDTFNCRRRQRDTVRGCLWWLGGKGNLTQETSIQRTQIIGNGGRG